jgi:RNase P subunit RPR2
VTKICKVCNWEKDLTEFPKTNSRATKQYYLSTCKTCNSIKKFEDSVGGIFGGNYLEHGCIDYSNDAELAWVKERLESGRYQHIA